MRRVIPEDLLLIERAVHGKLMVQRLNRIRLQQGLNIGIQICAKSESAAGDRAS